MIEKRKNAKKNGEKTMPDATETTKTGGGTFPPNMISEFFERFEESMKTWDGDRNGKIDGTEAVQGILRTPKLLALLFSAIGGVYSMITWWIGYSNEEINWIAMFFGAAIIIMSIVVYLILSNNSKASIQTVIRLNKQHGSIVANMVQNHEKHYGGLKERFIDYKVDMDQELQKLRNSLDGAKEEKSQIEALNNFRGAVIKMIQEKSPEYNTIDITKV